MKKLLLCIAALFSLMLCFGFKVNAASQEDITNLKNKVNTTIGVTLSDSMASQVIDKWQTSGYINCWVNKNTQGSVQITLANNYILQNGNYYLQTAYINTGFLTPSSTSTLVWNNQSAGSYVSGVAGYSCFVGKWEDFHTIPIDWANPQYNPNMPIPQFTTNYGEISVNSSSPEIPFDIDFVNPSSDYFIEIYVSYWIPNNMSISINRTLQNNDGFVYKALSRDLVYGYLIDPEQMLKISGINNFKLQLQTSWENALDQVPISSIEYANPNNLPSGMFTQYKNSYEDYCRKILGFYGSQFTIMMRYFAIVNDTQYVIGAWRTWTSYSPNEFTDRIPEYYVPYVPASGQENITNDVEPENVTVVPGTGTSTGVIADPSYYITVNQNVPNYPDYPTIRSYNADNFLVKTMNYLDYFDDPDTSHDLFGQFGKFCQSIFVFIPGEIWTIIAVGFSLVIVVMFLKIL